MAPLVLNRGPRVPRDARRMGPKPALRTSGPGHAGSRTAGASGSRAEEKPTRRSKRSESSSSRLRPRPRSTPRASGSARGAGDVPPPSSSSLCVSLAARADRVPARAACLCQVPVSGTPLDGFRSAGYRSPPATASALFTVLVNRRPRRRRSALAADVRGGLRRQLFSKRKPMHPICAVADTLQRIAPGGCTR